MKGRRRGKRFQKGNPAPPGYGNYEPVVVVVVLVVAVS